MKYFIKTLQFIKSIFSVHNCTMIVVEEIVMIVNWFFELDCDLILVRMVNYSLLIEQIDQTIQIYQTTIINTQRYQYYIIQYI